MTRQELQNKIISFSIETSFAETEIETQFLIVDIAAKNTHELILELKNNPDTSFDYLFCQTGVDFPEHMEILFHLRSTAHQHEMVVRAKIDNRKNPIIDSVYDLYKTAEYHEREIFDLFGVKFNNHPDLRRLFLDDEWEGYPLRKDYVDEINIVEL